MSIGSVFLGLVVIKVTSFNVLPQARKLLVTFALCSSALRASEASDGGRDRRTSQGVVIEGCCTHVF